MNKKKSEAANLIDEHTLMFVAIHELSHVMTKSIGHKSEFWENFKFLLENAKEAGIHDPKDYKKSRMVLENLIGLRDIDIRRFDIDTVFYRLGIYGDFDSIVKEISESNFLEIVSQYKDRSEINISFIK